MAEDAHFHNSPPSSVQVKNPYAGQQTAVAAGSRLYATNCSFCRGGAGQGNGTMPGVAQGPTQSAPDGEVFSFITTGAVMPGMEQLIREATMAARHLPEIAQEYCVACAWP